MRYADLEFTRCSTLNWDLRAREHYERIRRERPDLHLSPLPSGEVQRAFPMFPNGRGLCVMRGLLSIGDGPDYGTCRLDEPPPVWRGHTCVEDVQAEMDAVAALPPLGADSSSGAKRETPATSLAGVRSGARAESAPISLENKHADTCLASAADCRDRGRQGQGQDQEVAEAVQSATAGWTAPALVKAGDAAPGTTIRLPVTFLVVERSPHPSPHYVTLSLRVLHDNGRLGPLETVVLPKYRLAEVVA